jgi:hypothetical protein
MTAPLTTKPMDQLRNDELIDGLFDEGILVGAKKYGQLYGTEHIHQPRDLKRELLRRLGSGGDTDDPATSP